MLEFKEITLNDKSEIKSYLDKGNLGVCEHCFTDIYMWKGHYQTKFTTDGEFLYIKSKSTEDGRDLFMCPVGEGDIKKAISKLDEYTKSQGTELIIVSITDEMKEKLYEIYGDDIVFYENRDSSDYIYLSERLATLSGKKLHSKRNFVNRFMAQNEGRWSFELLNDENVADAWNFHTKWFKETGCVEEEKSLEAETCAIKLVLDSYKDLDVKGGILRIDGEVIAFTLGTKSTDEIFVVQIEKADTTFEGAYPVINKLFAMENTEEFKYLNREEDLGLEGLRKSKLSYKPDILRIKYAAKFKN